MKITDKQRQHIQALAAGERKAKPGLHAGVLNSLHFRGLATTRHAAPNESPYWRLTPAGWAEYDAITSGERT